MNNNFNDIKKNLKNEINNQNRIIDNKLKDNINKIEIIKKYKEIIEYKDLVKKRENEIEIINLEKEEKNEEYKNNILKTNNINEDIEIFKEEINNKINNIDEKIINTENNIKEKEIIIKNRNDEVNNNNKIKESNKNINNKYKNNNNEYTNKINYKFKKEPNLKYKLDITNTNTQWGWNDIFEIFISYKDNKEYLISPNKNNFNLDIFILLNNNKILSLLGHNNNIRTVRYFINKKDNNEYLISGDENKIVIIWDITNNYKIKYRIDTNYSNDIYSCLLIFPHNNDENYIITSTYNTSYDIDKSSTKIYSLNNGKFIKCINNTNNYHIFYLLSWYNKKNNKYYIIQFSKFEIIINNLIEDELYSELKQEPEYYHYSGFIYEKENNDYLCSSSYNGYINIWDLYNKTIFKVIITNNCILSHIIKWNNKYIIVADYENKSFKIIDLEENKIICDIKGQHSNNVICIKKIYHPFYGESLLSAADDNTIKLWSI